MGVFTLTPDTDDVDESDPDHQPGDERYREYILGVRVVERRGDGGATYRFDAPGHDGVVFDDPELATLYADVYFDVNGFQESGTGDRGVPPEVIQGGRDTMAAYLYAQFGDIHWLASFFGRRPGQINQYIEAVRTRAEEIRDRAEERGIA